MRKENVVARKEIQAGKRLRQVAMGLMRNKSGM